MSEEKASAAPGRPRIEMDEQAFGQLISMVRIHCTAEECASVLGFSPDTLDRRLKERGYTGWSDFWDRHSSEGKASLRRLQWKSAEDGNITAQIWLGKQYLGQRDFSRAEISGPEGGPVPVHIPFQDAVLAALRRKHGTDPE